MANTQQKEILEASLCTHNSSEKHLKMILHYLNLIPQYATVTTFSLSAYLLHTVTHTLTMEQNALLAVGDEQQKKVKICLRCWSSSKLHNSYGVPDPQAHRQRTEFVRVMVSSHQVIKSFRDWVSAFSIFSTESRLDLHRCNQRHKFSSLSSKYNMKKGKQTSLTFRFMVQLLNVVC